MSLVAVVVVAFMAIAAMVGAADAQPARVPLIGFLSPQPSIGGPTIPHVRAFHDALRELGWTPGQNVRFEYRWADGRHERLESLAQELVRLKPDVILANSGPAASAAKRAIP